MLVGVLSSDRSPLGLPLAEWLACPLYLDHEAAESCDLLLSAGYHRIIPQSFLAGRRIANLHTGYLPWNRGAYPNVWPLLDGSPAGVTLHWMDAGLDTGPIIAQAQVPKLPWDTAGTLGDRLTEAALSLAKAHWGDVLANVPGTPQPAGGSVHRKAELDELTLTPDTVTTVLDVLTTLQARTCGDYGCPIQVGGRWVQAQVALSPLS